MSEAKENSARCCSLYIYLFFIRNVTSDYKIHHFSFFRSYSQGKPFEEEDSSCSWLNANRNRQTTST